MTQPQHATSDPAAPWHARSAEDALEELEVGSGRGLSAQQVADRTSQYGPNELPRADRSGVWRILSRQFRSVMVLVLMVASVASFFAGDVLDAVAILAMVLLTTLLGFRQEYRAERAMAALERLASPEARVVREGTKDSIPSRELVPGDVVLLEAGSLVPADLRLLEVHALKVDEASLTGESHPVEKDATYLGEPETVVGDRLNMAYLGTTVTAGRGKAVVVATGPRTEMGGISKMLEEGTLQPTPLQRKLETLGRKLVLVALGLVGVVFLEGWLRGEELRTLLLTSISLAVAAVPEGLPAVIAIVLALGSQRMLSRGALVRRLAAVETLGSVTVICSDKTGTLTQNQLEVAQVYVDGKHYDFGEKAADGAASRPEAPGTDSPAAVLLSCAGLSTDVTGSAEEGWTGDPTEVALVQGAARYGAGRHEMAEAWPRTEELPFDSDRKRMTTVHRIRNPDLAPGLPLQGSEYLAITKGAADGMLQLVSRIWTQGSIEPLPADGKEQLAAIHDEMAASGMRVLAVALQPLPRSSSTPEELEANLIFAGFVGLVDPPRPEAREAVARCKQAGIRIIMITGDHALTAGRIAEQLKIGNQAPALGAEDLKRLVDGRINEVLDIGVIARVSPAEKLTLVEALQDNGHIVAMTGDGINDAPALSRADVGVAMGNIGTDAAREASDLILQDDNFATIVAAVEEGRRIGSNVRKFIFYLLSCNAGELWLVLLAPLFGMPLPLTPLQILWINLVTDGFPALALASEPPDADAMQRPPRPPQLGVLGRVRVISILWTGFVMGSVAFLAGYRYLAAQQSNWQSVVFAIVVFSQLWLALGSRSESRSVLRMGVWTNPALIYAVAGTAALQFLVLYTPLGQRIFKVQALDTATLGVALLVSSIPLLGLELRKWWLRRREPGAREGN